MISLVVTSRNRVMEPERFLKGLSEQTYRDFQVIFVDQNPDDRLLSVIQNYGNLPLRYLHAPTEKGASRGRNLGMRLATGDIIGIPDDDSWYRSDLLDSVVRWMDQHAAFDMLCTIKRNSGGQPIGPRWPAAACECTRRNIWNTGISSTVFLRRRVCEVVGAFDENIGVGSATKYQSGEETDFFLRAFNRGFRMWFEPSITVYHSDLQPIERLRGKAYPYALGTGYVLRAHGYGFTGLANMVGRSLGGSLLNALRGDGARAYAYAQRAAGELIGYFDCREMLRRSPISRSAKTDGQR